MSKKLYIGNLAYTVDDNQLGQMFSPFGEVVSATVISDRHSGRSKGFGFVEYKEEKEAEKAIKEMGGKEVDGRALVVNEARPQKPREFPGGGRDNQFRG